MNNQKSAVERRYSDLRFVAAYIEAEWGDFLFPSEVSHEVSTAKMFSSRFYQEVAQYISTIIEQPVRRLLDVGCATGRFCYEWLQSSPQTEECTLCDLSGIFIGYAQRFLECREPIDSVPVMNSLLAAKMRSPEGSVIEVPRTCQLAFHSGPVERAPVLPNYFDLVTAFNVVDRHADPCAFISGLARFLKRGKYIAIASPMDWNETFTAREFWREDLREFLGPEWQVISSTDLDYPFRYSPRKALMFKTQVVVASLT